MGCLSRKRGYCIIVELSDNGMEIRDKKEAKHEALIF